MKKTLPMLPLRGKYIFPNTVIHFDVSRSRSVKAIEEAMEHDQMIFLNNQIDPTAEDPGIEDLYRVGTLARIKQVVKLPKNILRVFAEGLFRAELSETVEYEPFYKVEVLYDHVEQQSFEEFEREAFLRMIKEAFEGYAKAWPHLDQNMVNYILLLTDVEILVDELATHIPFSYPEKQKLLEEMDLKERCELMLVMLQEELDVLKLKQKIQQKVKVNIDKNQKEYVLREQIKVIREELGETNVEDEADEFMEKLKNLKASDEVKEKLKKEISRFQTMGNQTPESSVLRTYIETMFEVPWEEMSEDSTDLDHAQQVLDRDHYGMEKVKERVLEYLAARAMSGKKDAAILCLVGPPGTGKTSIARSIAKATNKKYIRLSLGGVRDESEIRGHRKTYVGAMPGRIVEALKKVKVRNPLMLLDEIDKTGKDQRGDTASALLEVLDPEQNEHFTDHYLEVALNLSDVLFVATANDLSTIPRPLFDRMEIIEINTYTQNEKLHIAKEHLIEKQMKANGIKAKQLTISDKAIEDIILYYTRESGVRGLERCLGDICRKTARMILQDGKKNVKVTEKNLEHFLGTKKYDYEMANAKNEIGIVRGLAWTSVGGDTLSIEVNVMPGKGKFELTGHLGDVMKESAMAAISYIRSVRDQFNIDREFFEKNDIHIHIPEGAVPKDGPSAGVTMATAMLSAITGTPVRADVAMTGEITLRGRVLPIGGLREKSIAAKVAGIHTVIVPEKNRRDIKELDKEITKDMKFVYASTMADILPVALESMPKAQAANS